MTKKLLRPSKILSPVAKVLTLLALTAGGVSAQTPSDLVKGRDEGQRNQQTKKAIHAKQTKRQKEDELLLPAPTSTGLSASRVSMIKEVNAGVLVPFFGLGADNGYALARDGSDSVGGDQTDAPKDVHTTQLLNQSVNISGKLYLEGRTSPHLHGVSGQDQYAKWDVAGGIEANLSYPDNRGWNYFAPISNVGGRNNRLYVTTEGDINLTVRGFHTDTYYGEYERPRGFYSNVQNGVSRLTANNIFLKSDDVGVELTSIGYVHNGQQLFNVGYFTAKNKIRIEGAHRAIELSGKSTGFINARDVSIISTASDNSNGSLINLSNGAKLSIAAEDIHIRQSMNHEVVRANGINVSGGSILKVTGYNASEELAPTEASKNSTSGSEQPKVGEVKIISDVNVSGGGQVRFDLRSDKSVFKGKSTVSSAGRFDLRLEGGQWLVSDTSKVTTLDGGKNKNTTINLRKEVRASEAATFNKLNIGSLNGNGINFLLDVEFSKAGSNADQIIINSYSEGEHLIYLAGTGSAQVGASRLLKNLVVDHFGAATFKLANDGLVELGNYTYQFELQKKALSTGGYKWFLWDNDEAIPDKQLNHTTVKDFDEKTDQGYLDSINNGETDVPGLPGTPIYPEYKPGGQGSSAVTNPWHPEHIPGGTIISNKPSTGAGNIIGGIVFPDDAAVDEKDPNKITLPNGGTIAGVKLPAGAVIDKPVNGVIILPAGSEIAGVIVPEGTLLFPSENKAQLKQDQDFGPVKVDKDSEITIGSDGNITIESGSMGGIKLPSGSIVNPGNGTIKLPSNEGIDVEGTKIPGGSTITTPGEGRPGNVILPGNSTAVIGGVTIPAGRPVGDPDEHGYIKLPDGSKIGKDVLPNNSYLYIKKEGSDTPTHVYLTEEANYGGNKLPPGTVIIQGKNKLGGIGSFRLPSNTGALIGNVYFPAEALLIPDKNGDITVPKGTFVGVKFDKEGNIVEKQEIPEGSVVNPSKHTLTLSAEWSSQGVALPEGTVINFTNASAITVTLPQGKEITVGGVRIPENTSFVQGANGSLKVNGPSYLGTLQLPTYTEINGERDPDGTLRVALTVPSFTFKPEGTSAVTLPTGSVIYPAVVKDGAVVKPAYVKVSPNAGVVIAGATYPASSMIGLPDDKGNLTIKLPGSVENTYLISGVSFKGASVITASKDGVITIPVNTAKIGQYELPAGTLLQPSQNKLILETDTNFGTTLLPKGTVITPGVGLVLPADAGIRLPTSTGTVLEIPGGSVVSKPTANGKVTVTLGGPLKFDNLEVPKDSVINTADLSIKLPAGAAGNLQLGKITVLGGATLKPGVDNGMMVLGSSYVVVEQNGKTVQIDFPSGSTILPDGRVSLAQWAISGKSIPAGSIIDLNDGHLTLGANAAINGITYPKGTVLGAPNADGSFAATLPGEAKDKHNIGGVILEGGTIIEADLKGSFTIGEKDNAFLKESQLPAGTVVDVPNKLVTIAQDQQFNVIGTKFKDPIVLPGGSKINTQTGWVTLPDGGAVISGVKIPGNTNIKPTTDGGILLPPDSEAWGMKLPADSILKPDGTIQLGNGQVTGSMWPAGSVITPGADGPTVTLVNGGMIGGVLFGKGAVLKPALDGTITVPGGVTATLGGHLVPEGTLVKPGNKNTEGVITLPADVGMNVGNNVDLPGGTVIEPHLKKVTLASDKTAQIGHVTFPGGSVIQAAADGSIEITGNGVTVGGENVPIGSIVSKPTTDGWSTIKLPIDGGTFNEIKLPGNTLLNLKDQTATLPANGGEIKGQDYPGGTIISTNAQKDLILSLPDGKGMTVKGFELPGGSVVNATQGTVTLPKSGATILGVRFPANSVIKADKNGDVILPSGTTLGKNDLPTGSTLHRYSKGDVEITLSKDTTMGGTNLPEGSKIYPQHNTVKLPDGTLLTPEGTTTPPSGDKPGTITKPDGSIVLPDGGTIPELPGVELPPGTVIQPGIDGKPPVVTLPDKSDVEIMLPGDTAVTIPGGSVIDIGNQTVTLPSKGGFIGDTWYPGGSVVKPGESGTPSYTVTIPSTGGTIWNKLETPENGMKLPGGTIVDPTNNQLRLPGGTNLFGNKLPAGTIVNEDKTLTLSQATNMNGVVLPAGTIIKPVEQGNKGDDYWIQLPNSNHVTIAGVKFEAGSKIKPEFVEAGKPNKFDQVIKIPDSATLVNSITANNNLGVKLPSGSTITNAGTSGAYVTLGKLGENVALGKFPLPGGSKYNPSTKVITTPLGTTIKTNGKAFTGGWAGAIVTLHGKPDELVSVGKIKLPGGSIIDLNEDKLTLPNGNNFFGIIDKIENGADSGPDYKPEEKPDKPNAPEQKPEQKPPVTLPPASDEDTGDDSVDNAPGGDTEGSPGGGGSSGGDSSGSGGSSDSDSGSNGDSGGNGGSGTGGGAGGTSGGGNTNITINGGNPTININGTVNGSGSTGGSAGTPTLPKPVALSNTARAVLALANTQTQTAQYLGGLSDIRSRTGSLRHGAPEGGYVLSRAGKDKLTSFGGEKSSVKYGGATFGYDALVDNDLIIGANFSYLTGKSELKDKSVGGKGKMKSFGASAYATWFDQKGNYLDLVGSVGHYRNDINARMLGGIPTSGKYNTFGLGLSAEYGRTIRFGEREDWFVEPQVQLSYYWIKGKSFDMSNGMKVEQESASSLTGRAGVVVGKNIERASGLNTQLYLKAGVNHEFLGKNSLKLNGDTFKGNSLGTRAYVGLGVDSQINKRTKFFAQVEQESGSKFKSNINARIGVKYTF